ncbi:MAG: prolyl oligopeptidase family serine peptidase [Planctomycetaceae bacterium]|nr:prolyl oligopeptidase family serine peptidase [Planctomycetaceae bacterium]
MRLPTHTRLMLILAAWSSVSALVRADEFADYGASLSKRLGLQATALEVAGKRAFVILPAAEKQQTPQPWIMYAPTLPDYPDQHEAWMHRQFVEAGIAVAGIDAGEAYGSPDGCQALSALYQQLVERRDFARQPCLLGRSRGGLWVTNWAVDNPELVAGIAGIYPVFNLQDYPGLANAAPAYHLTESQLQQQLAEFNPVARLQPLIAARTPMFMVHGDVDDVVPLATNSAAVAEKFQSAGAGDCVTIKVIKGQGHNFDESFFKCQELVDFATKQAREGAQP